MTLVARPAPPNTKIADTVTPVLAPEALDALWADGYRALGRYRQNLTAEELAVGTAYGFGYLLIGESRAEGWAPSKATGTADAAAFLAWAKQLAIPVGACLVDDCETPGQAVPTSDRIAHVDAYAAPVAGAGYLAATYIGEGYGLTGSEWQARPNVHRYGKSCSRLLDYASNVIEPARGYSWVQGRPPNLRVGPTPIDGGLLTQDYQGGSMVLVYDDAHAPAA